MTQYICRDCSTQYPDTGLPHVCTNCGGAFTLKDLSYLPPIKEDRNSQGIWKYASSFGLPASYPTAYLGEGNTPLVPVNIQGKEFWAKLENLNPSGSLVCHDPLSCYRTVINVEDSSGMRVVHWLSIVLSEFTADFHPQWHQRTNAGKLRFGAKWSRWMDRGECAYSRWRRSAGKGSLRQLCGSTLRLGGIATIAFEIGNTGRDAWDGFARWT